jgi:hypothetical protein
MGYYVIYKYARLKILSKTLQHGRMTALSDTLTIGLVLVLLFGSIALYLYTRIQQAEQKISLLESILLDLKMSAEIKSYTELPAESIQSNEYATYNELAEDDEDLAPGVTIKAYSPRGSVASSQGQQEEQDQHGQQDDFESYKAIIESAVNDNVIEDSKADAKDSKSSANYEAMNLKELQVIAKQRNIIGASSMKKGPIIEALRTSDKAVSNIESGSAGASSFLDTSSFLGETQ